MNYILKYYFILYLEQHSLLQYVAPKPKTVSTIVSCIYTPTMQTHLSLMSMGDKVYLYSAPHLI